MNLARVDPQVAEYECRAIARGDASYAKMASHAPDGVFRALDVGCGSGRLVLHLAERVRFIIGLDLSPRLIALARERQTQQGKNNVAWVVANAQHLPFARASFDYVTSNSALRFTDLDQSLPDIRRSIKAGGQLFIQDLVLSSARQSYILHIVMTLRWARKMYQVFGLLGMSHWLVYALTPASFEKSRRRKINRDLFVDKYRLYFPSSQIQKCTRYHTVAWQNLDSTNGSLNQGGDS